jgi:histidinol dehydrogenase
MIRRIDLRGTTDSAATPGYRGVVPRAEMDVEATLEVVRPICEAVRDRGVEAITGFAARFDGVEQTDIAVPTAALDRALAELDPAVRAGLEEAVRRLRLTCEAELEADVVTEVVPGGTVVQRMVPVERVGLYVPGGLAPLVSSVVMNVVPAQVAGVGSIALTSSPQKGHGGLPHPTILAACAMLGVEEVYAVGGAQAVAMFAYGAGPCRPVDMVTGPGNIYTVSAKRLLKGVVGIDSEAGPTEIAVLADDTAEAPFVAADLISQAEHDPDAASVLVTPSERLAAEVEAELDKQISVTKHVERITTVLLVPASVVAATTMAAVGRLLGPDVPGAGDDLVRRGGSVAAELAVSAVQVYLMWPIAMLAGALMVLWSSSEALPPSHSSDPSGPEPATEAT